METNNFLRLILCLESVANCRQKGLSSSVSLIQKVGSMSLCDIFVCTMTTYIFAISDDQIPVCREHGRHRARGAILPAVFTWQSDGVADDSCEAVSCTYRKTGYSLLTNFGQQFRCRTPYVFWHVFFRTELDVADFFRLTVTMFWVTLLYSDALVTTPAMRCWEL